MAALIVPIGILAVQVVAFILYSRSLKKRNRRVIRTGPHSMMEVVDDRAREWAMKNAARRRKPPTNPPPANPPPFGESTTGDESPWLDTWPRDGPRL